MPEEYEAILDRWLHVIKEQHKANDHLFALHIDRSRRDGEIFLPSQCGQPWEAHKLGYRTIVRAGHIPIEMRLRTALRGQG
jgi:hypothetical protein